MGVKPSKRSMGYKKKSERTKLVEECDRLFSLIIRGRDDNTCVTCGSKEQPTNGHLWSRTAYSTRWDYENCWCQCWGCNLKHEYDPYNFQEFVRDKLGQSVYDALHLRYRTTKQFKNHQLKDMIEEFKCLLEKRKQL